MVSPTDSSHLTLSSRCCPTLRVCSRVLCLSTCVGLQRIYPATLGAHGAGGVHRGYSGEGGGGRSQGLLGDAQAQGGERWRQEKAPKHHRNSSVGHAQKKARVTCFRTFLRVAFDPPFRDFFFLIYSL